MIFESHKRSSIYPVISNYSHSQNNSLDQLEREILSIENELQNIGSRIHTLEAQIHNRYSAEILRIRELNAIHKKQKNVKKEKRLEQKKRGKNYRETTSLKKKISKNVNNDCTTTIDNQKELKKLYREAIVQVHPDKFVNEPLEKSKRSQELTIQLIDIYQNGDIEQLKYFHSYIVSGNAMSYSQSQGDSLPDPDAMCDFLTKKRDDLAIALNEAKQSRLYEVLTTYEEPLRFIDELSVQLLNRTRQLEKRTRINKKKDGRKVN